MTDKPVADANPVVLRGVVLRAEPRALVRPARAQVAAPVRGVAQAPLAGVAQGGVHARHDDDAAYQEAVQRGLKDGYADGYRDGLKKAADAAGQQIRDAVDAAVAQARVPLQERAERLDALLGALAGKTQDCIDAAEDDIAALSFDVVCRILGDKAVTPDGVLAQLQQALGAWRGKQALTLHLHPDDARLLRDDESLAQALHGTRPGQLHWRADASVALGGCVIHSAEGGLDARLEVQMESFKALLLQARAARPAAGTDSANTITLKPGATP